MENSNSSESVRAKLTRGESGFSITSRIQNAKQKQVLVEKPYIANDFGVVTTDQGSKDETENPSQA